MKVSAIKRWFQFNFGQILQGLYFVADGLQNFNQIFLLKGLSKNCIAEITAVFVYLLLKILAGKKAPSNKTPALTKSENMGIWVVGTSN